MDKFSIILGRILLGFISCSGISKIPTYAGTTEYMLLHNIPLASILLPITIVLQIGLGVMLIIGYRIKESALILAALTIFINIGMHDFWNEYPNTDAGHETQNFVKNFSNLCWTACVKRNWAQLDRVQQWRLFKETLGVVGDK